MTCIHELPIGQCADCRTRTTAPLRCRACPQTLTNPISIYFGVGPVCFVTDRTATELARRVVAAEEGKSLRFGPLAEHVAAAWRVAFRSLDSVAEVHCWRDPDGYYVWLKPIGRGTE